MIRLYSVRLSHTSVNIALRAGERVKGKGKQGRQALMTGHWSLITRSLAEETSAGSLLLNAEINHCYQEGGTGESVTPESGVGDLSEDCEVLFIIESSKSNGNGQDG
jgi:hypothetical protein